MLRQDRPRERDRDSRPRRRGADAERDTPQAQPLLEALLPAPRRDGPATLVLLDELLMFLRARVEADSAWRGRLLASFQSLTQAAVKVDNCAVVASLLASDPRRNDDPGAAPFAELSNVFSRRTEEAASPVGKADVGRGPAPPLLRTGVGLRSHRVPPARRRHRPAGRGDPQAAPRCGGALPGRLPAPPRPDRGLLRPLGPGRGLPERAAYCGPSPSRCATPRSPACPRRRGSYARSPAWTRTKAAPGNGRPSSRASATRRAPCSRRRRSCAIARSNRRSSACS